MVMADGGYGAWAVRLEQACETLLPEARWLQADVGGPVDAVRRMAASGVWGGPFADELQGALRWVDGNIVAWGQHLGHLHGALDDAAREADGAARLETAGVVPSFDLPGALAPWQRWPAASSPLPMDWAGGGAWRGAVVWVEPDGARQLAEGIRSAADQLRGAQRRVATALSTVGIDTPPFLTPVTDGLDEIANEIDRRVTMLENVDRELAGAFRDLAARLGFPGRLAPPSRFDPADPLDSARAGLTPGADIGPGQQAAQAMEADPVSTSTGNLLYQAVDLVQPARGVPMIFARTYNGLRAGVAGPLGFGWSHRFGAHLLADPAAVTVVWGDGRHDRYVWEAGGFVSPPGVFDRLGVDGPGWTVITKDKVAYRFDPDGGLSEMVDRCGNRFRIERDDAGHLVGFVDGSGTTTAVEYDEVGQVTAVVGPLGRRWTYSYDEAGNLIAVSDPEGGTTRYGYDQAHRLVSVTDPEDRLVVRNSYDETSPVVAQHDGAGGRWTYDYRSGVTLVTDPLGQAKRFEYDLRYRTTAVIDPTGAATRFGWDDADRLTSATDPTGHSFRFGWNQRGNLVSAQGPGRDPVRYEWDENDNLTGVLGPAGTRTAYAWDDRSLPVTLRSPAGVTTTITWREDGLPASVADGIGAVTRYDYDPAGRLAAATDPLDATTRMEFDAAGRPVIEVHPGGGRTTFEWDRADRLVAVTDAAGATSRYSYDRSGRLVAAADGLGHTTRYRYDQRGLLVSVTDPLGRETTLSYDAAGHVVRRSDDRELPTSFSYDRAGRLVRIEGVGMVPLIYTWDRAGRLVGMADETGETTWELDAAGRPVAERRPDGTTLTHVYDPLGRRRRLELHRGENLLAAWDHTIDADGRITAVADHAGATTGLTYDPAGRLSQIRWPNGVTATWAFDSAGQPIALDLTGADDAVLSAWTAVFDDDGNRTRTTHFVPGAEGEHVTDYAYDLLGRLTNVGGHGGAGYTWDAAHNRVEGPNRRKAAFDSADQIIADESNTYQHDLAGNLVARRPLGDDEAPLFLTHDALGRITTVRDADGEVRFGYDALGRRRCRGDATGTVTRVFDGPNLIAELGPDDKIDLATTAGLLVLAHHTPAGVRHLHPGPNTHVAAVTDPDGRLLAHYHYEPFGERSTIEGDPYAAGPYGFCGTLGVREEAAGLLDMRARFYDPSLGRFTGPDPWPARQPEPMTINRYLYALADPISQVDPHGLFCVTGKNKQGKCRGLKDVTQRSGQAVATPLDITSTVFTGVAAVAAGVTALCVFPCGIISGPIAAGAESIALGTGVAAGLAHCASALSFTDFDCAVGIAEGSIGGFLGRGVTAAAGVLRWSDEGRAVAEFGSQIFALFVRGTVTASGGKDK